MQPDTVLDIYDVTVLEKEAFFFELADAINYMITHNFEKLVQLLYRIDVNEQKLKKMLQTYNEEAGKIIARLIIERQLEKIKTRQQFRQKGGDW